MTDKQLLIDCRKLIHGREQMGYAIGTLIDRLDAALAQSAAQGKGTGRHIAAFILDGKQSKEGEA